MKACASRHLLPPSQLVNVGHDLEIWGGIECTVNRVGDRYHSQLTLCGHDKRPADLDAIASLGLRTLRYPALWELIAPQGLSAADWTWPEERLRRLRQLGIDPIVGLVHHGSGPPGAGLLEPGFALGLEAYAAEFARRFPWVQRYTPVNEPLTTARFAGLYGLWHPHRSDDRAFVRALLNQCRATVLSMQAVRLVNPRAQLVQTDDLGRVYSTQRLSYQADFENERRWLGWDLLCGRVDSGHAMWGYLRAHGVSDVELLWFRDHPCPPDVVGINHYLTSDRFLHDELQLFPTAYHGGNRSERYADVEAVRVLPDRGTGLGGLLREAWERYRLPLAVTEVHLGCSREEQLRWLYEAWSVASAARTSGIEVRAVTAWALLGSFDWRSLLTEFTGCYEPGAFDVRAGTPRPTALAGLVSDLCAGRTPRDAALLADQGWWWRAQRLLLPHARRQIARPASPEREAGSRSVCAPELIVVGASGTLGCAFGRACSARGLRHRMLPRSALDICDRAAVAEALEQLAPWAVINAAGYVRVDDAESDGMRCHRINAAGPANLASECAARGIRLLTFSSDLVFDGNRTSPYVESDVVRPLNVYGASKACAERAVLARHPRALVARTSAFFGPWDRHSFLAVTLAALRRGEAPVAIDDVVVSPTYVPDLVDSCLDLLIDKESGIWHVANRGVITWAELARAAARLADVRADRLRAVPLGTLGLAAARPVYSAITSERGMVLPTLEDALIRYVKTVEPAASTAGIA